jgi:predicted TIM-barrel fold metal-dependent hydrolase
MVATPSTSASDSSSETPAERLGAVDMLVGLPGPGYDYWSHKIENVLMDWDEEYDKHLAPHLFGKSGVPEGVRSPEFIDDLLAMMDEARIDLGVTSFAYEDRESRDLVERHPDRFVCAVNVDPNDGMKAVRQVESAVREFGAKAVALLPVSYSPQVPIDDRKMYPIYAKCVELDIAAMISVGVPGPRVPFAAQRVDLIDEVCWFFPELRVIMRHGADPWVDLAVKLLHKYPNLYYCTSGWAPRHYPRAIVDFANTRGADKILYGGYVPFGLTWERIFREIPEVGFKPAVLRDFLRNNAIRALKLDAPLDRGTDG